MTLTEVDTSPLRAAREWRELSLVAAARASGMQMSAAEALEDGDASAFGTLEEMVAAAVLYGATLGIGRDEAMALLDRTITGGGPEFSDRKIVSGGTAAFSAAVRGRTSAPVVVDPYAGPEAAVLPAMPEVPGEEQAPGGGAWNTLTAGELEFFEHELPQMETSSGAASSVETTGEIPMIAAGGLLSAQNAALEPQSSTVRAAMELDPEWRRALEESHGELDQWSAQRQGGSPALRAVGRKLRQAGDRTIGADRTDRAVEVMWAWQDQTRDALRDVRTRLERSEHATLIVALAVGLVLVAAMIGIASATGGGTEVKKPASSAVQPPTTQGAPAGAAAGAPAAAVKPADASAAAAAKTAAPAVKPVLPPAKVRLEVLNAGGRTGYAKVVAGRLQARGYQVKDVGNSNSRYGTSVILYPAGLQREAQRLSKQTAITTLDTLPAGRSTSTITVVVV